MAVVTMMRPGVFGVSLLFSVIVLGLDGHVISLFNQIVSPPASNSLGLADAVLTLVFLTPLLVIDLLRQGAMISMVLVDLIVVFILWVLWLAAGADTASQWRGSCTDTIDSTETVTTPGCGEAKAAAAFSFLIFFALLAYWVTLLVYSIMAMNKGNENIWTTPVSDAFSEKPPQSFNAPTGTGYPQQQQQQAMPGNQQYQGGNLA